MPTVELKLRPFMTPNFALAETAPHSGQEGFREPPKFALSELSPETLSTLCDQFRAEVFKKASQRDPHPRAEQPRPGTGDEG